MRRSEINEIIRSAIRFFEQHRFELPPWAGWTPDDWRRVGPECSEIIENMLGWDITDFGAGDFHSRGLLLVTLRNGAPSGQGKPYAEKIMIVEESQETPMHFHWNKMEDIINRGGGNLVIEIFGSTDEEEPAEASVRLRVDGVERVVPPGGKIILTPGESICLETGVYHRFYGEPGKGTVLVGEVSQVNDDNADNRFLEQQGRFPEIDEDEPPVRLLVSDYAKWVGPLKPANTSAGADDV